MLGNSVEYLSHESVNQHLFQFYKLDIEQFLGNLNRKNPFSLSNPTREVYKLTISNNPTIIQGLISLEVKEEHVYIHLIESAPFNIGSNKVYLGVPGNLIAFACKLSFQRCGEGYVAFLSKTKLIEHYEKSLGAIHIGGRNMVITTSSALILTNKYFKQ